jgi:hypothetical protein
MMERKENNQAACAHRSSISIAVNVGVWHSQSAGCWDDELQIGQEGDVQLSQKKLEVQRPRILSRARPAGNVLLCTIARS